jgi:hypothetical protein
MGTQQRRLTRAAHATVVAELLYTREGGGLGAVAVTPMVQDGRVVIALPYAERPLAEALAAASQVALVLSDGRMALRDWEPLAVLGRIEVEADPEGERFSDGLLEQELRKHPPSRTLTDSLRDRRDNWWYIPRLLCHLIPTDEVRQITARNDPTTGVLGWQTPEGLAVETVEVTDADEDRLRLRALSGSTLRGAGDPAVLFRHDYSQPDLEQRSQRREAGRLDGSVLRDIEREGDVALPPPAKLVERVRRHRALAKACRRELARDR